MARISHQYRHHKASDRAFVVFDGKRVYLGKYGTEESKERYRLALLEYRTTGKAPGTAPVDQTSAVSVNELILAYVQHVEGYYVQPDGTPTGEVGNIKRALKVLKRKFGTMDATHFGPDELEACRNEMIRMGWCRRSCNVNTYRIRRGFKWAARKRLVPPAVFAGLTIVEGLAPFRSPAPETEPVKPVPDSIVDACLPEMPAMVAAMVQIQRLTGMRPGEVVAMKARYLTMGDDVWVYAPPRHKNAWRGKARSIYLGPKAQEILRPLLSTNLDDFLFDASLEKEHAKMRRRRGLSQPTDGYSVDSYRRAITRACHRANVPVWGPNRLRHTRGTEVRRQFGLEAASVVLGHARCDVTQVYAEANTERALEIVRQTG